MYCHGVNKLKINVIYSTSTRPGEGAIYRYLSRKGKIARGGYPRDEVEWIIS